MSARPACRLVPCGIVAYSIWDSQVDIPRQATSDSRCHFRMESIQTVGMGVTGCIDFVAQPKPTSKTSKPRVRQLARFGIT